MYVCTVILTKTYICIMSYHITNLHVVDRIAHKHNATRRRGRPVREHRLGHARIGLVHVHEVVRLQVVARAGGQVPLVAVVDYAVAMNDMRESMSNTKG